MKKPVVLVVLDGWGYREEKKDNAIASASKPNFDKLWQTYPHSLLQASGLAVGLPQGQIGDSNVGHLTIGSGRPIDTYLVRINKAIQNGEFEKSEVLNNLIDHTKKHGSTVHVMGLVSPGGVHSHEDHMYAFLDLCATKNIERVSIHVFTDGRDTKPQSAKEYIERLERKLESLNRDYHISSISGRYFAMDRDKNWDRIQKAWDVINATSPSHFDSKVSQYLEQKYNEGEKDELLTPSVCKVHEIYGDPIKENDGIFYFNFRADRARELSQKILEIKSAKNLFFATMTQYKEDFDAEVVFPPLFPDKTLGKIIAENNLSQVHIAETEKYAHATYFLNGGQEIPNKNEEDILIQSRQDIVTHDEAPEMKAFEITEKAIEKINEGKDFIFINYANADMVGHTANVNAIIKAVESVDSCLGRLYDHIQKKGGILFVTADHGNAEVNADPITHTPSTDHTTNPVPCIITLPDMRLRDGSLSDVAPTILSLFNLNIPKEMTGKSLLLSKE